MDREELKLITKICYLYYYEEEVQSKIAKRFNLTRQMVSRLIQKAKDEGILKIIIESPLEEVIGLETELENKFGLKEAVVIQNDTLTDDELIRKVGKAAGEYLLKVMSPKLSIGIGFGETIESMAELVSQSNLTGEFKDVYYYQLTGGINSPSSYDNSQFILHLISKGTKGNTVCMNLPSIVEDKNVRDTMVESAMYERFIDAYNNLDYAFVQINSAERIYQSNEQEINAANRKYLNMLGINYLNNIDAAGEICLNYFNDRGHFIESPLDEKAITISSKKLKGTNNLVGIAAGSKTHQATLGAIKSKAFDVLITDDETAKYLLQN